MVPIESIVMEILLVVLFQIVYSLLLQIISLRDISKFLFEVFIPRAALMACAPGEAEKDVKADDGFHVF